jgi:hypothetical protein
MSISIPRPIYRGRIRGQLSYLARQLTAQAAGVTHQLAVGGRTALTAADAAAMQALATRITSALAARL